MTHLEKLTVRSPVNSKRCRPSKQATASPTSQVALEDAKSEDGPQPTPSESPKDLVLSDFDPNKRRTRKKAGASQLFNQIGVSQLIRPFLPANQDQDEDKHNSDFEDEDEMLARRIKSADTTNIPVFRSQSPTAPTAEDSILIDKRSDHPADDDGYSPELYLRQLRATLSPKTSKQNKMTEGSPMMSAKSKATPTVAVATSRSAKPTSTKLERSMQARRYFTPKLLGKNEEEFQKSKFPDIVKTSFFSEDMHGMMEASVGPDIGHGGGVHAFPHFHKPWGEWLNWSNCGTCHILKIVIVGVILCAIVGQLFDPCFLGTAPSPVPTPENFTMDGNESSRPSTASHLRSLDPMQQATTNTAAPRATTSAHHPTLYLIGLLQQQKSNVHDRWAIHHRMEPQHRDTPTSSPFPGQLERNRNASFLLTRGTQEEQEPLPNANISSLAMPEYCVFKALFMVACGLNVLAYLIVYSIFTCQLVVQYYNVDWFLYESCLILITSILLFCGSVAGFFLTDSPITNSVLLITSLLGLTIAYWAWANHQGGFNPLLMITTSNPDMDEIAQILSRKQFSKFFKFGREPGDEENNVQRQKT